MKSKKTSILFDTLLLDNPHTGIATYCRHLGMAFLSEKFNLLPTYYLREKTDCSFPSSQLFYWKRHHKYFLHLPSSTDLIHCTFQLAKYFGNNTFKRQKKVLTVHDLNFLYESYKHPNAMKRLKKKRKKGGPYRLYFKICLQRLIKKSRYKSKESVCYL